MSHFVGLVLVPNTVELNAKALERAISPMVAPWSEDHGTEDERYWDWWMLGGRWTNYFGSILQPSYDPEKDPDNYEQCNICNGTGHRKPPPAVGPGTMPWVGGRGDMLPGRLRRLTATDWESAARPGY